MLKAVCKQQPAFSICITFYFSKKQPAFLHLNMPFDHRGQLYWQLTQIGNIQKRIAIDTLNVWLIIANSCSDKRNSFPAVFLLDSP